ncbi:MAG: MYXO-CTERM sorting domain-containing protein [Deltaproteobacteria bacterium]|nr:MYXO-CTERM sorting domain-containing protein [Deltaproteobacteria bacterium]
MRYVILTVILGALVASSPVFANPMPVDDDAGVDEFCQTVCDRGDACDVSCALDDCLTSCAADASAFADCDPEDACDAFAACLCAAMEAGGPAESDDDNDDGGGCSVAGGKTPGLELSGLMAAIGFAAFWFGRRR